MFKAHPVHPVFDFTMRLNTPRKFYLKRLTCGFFFWRKTLHVLKANMFLRQTWEKTSLFLQMLSINFVSLRPPKLIDPACVWFCTGSRFWLSLWGEKSVVFTLEQIVSRASSQRRTNGPWLLRRLRLIKRVGVIKSGGFNLSNLTGAFWFIVLNSEIKSGVSC